MIININLFENENKFSYNRETLYKLTLFFLSAFDVYPINKSYVKFTNQMTKNDLIKQV